MTSPDEFREKTVEELREQARKQGVSGASEMRKDELVQALSGGGDTSPSSTGGAGAWMRDRSLGVFFVSLFLASWVGQLIVQWFNFVNQQRDHDQTAGSWSG